MSTYAFTRAVTILATGFLLLNAALLLMIDHAGWAGVCAGAALLVVLGWFRYRRMRRELANARREMKREVESLRELLQTRPPPPHRN